MKTTGIVLVGLMVLGLSGLAVAQSEWPQTLLDMAPPASFIEAEPVVFASGEPSIELGGTSTVLVNVVNDGDASVEVKRIMGSLNSPLQFSFLIVNITGRQLNTVVPPDSEYTFAIDIDAPWKNMDEGTLQMALVLFYEDADVAVESRERYSTVFFNSTVRLFYPEETFASSVQSAVTGVGLVAFVALVGVYFVTGGNSSSGRSADAKVVQESFEQGLDKESRELLQKKREKQRRQQAKKTS